MCCDLLMQHNVVCAIAIRVHLKMDKPLDYSVEAEEHPWPYLTKMFQYAGVSKDSYKMMCLICLKGMNSIELNWKKAHWSQFH